MADSFYTANMLAEYSLNLMRGQMITQLMAGQTSAGGGMSLTEYILGKPRSAGRRSCPDADNAARRLMNGNSASLREASKCMLMAKALLETGGESIILILNNIRRMNSITAEIRCGAGNKAALRAEYAALAARIKSIIEGASFDGVKLLDGEAWKNDGRVTVNGDTGKLGLGSGESRSEVTLYDLQGYKNAFQAGDLEQGALQATSGGLEQFAGMLEGMASSYRARAGLLNTEAAGFERQADILDEACGKAAPGDEAGLKDALVSILLRDGESILSGAS